MKVSYGVGLLNIVPSEWFEEEEEEQPKQQFSSKIPGGRRGGRGRKDRSPSKENAKRYLLEVAQMGMAKIFYEKVEDEVLMVEARGSTVSAEWVDKSEGEPIADLLQNLRGEIHYDQLPDGLDADFYFPGYRGREGRKITLPGFDVSGFAHGLDHAVRILQRAMPSVPAMDQDFVRDLMNAVEDAHANRLIFWFWYG